MIQALPAAAGMSNLLLDLAACTSACLGVLVEAFPNKVGSTTVCCCVLVDVLVCCCVVVAVDCVWVRRL